MADGRRHRALHDSFQSRVPPLFAGRVLPFDLAAIRNYAALIARARAAGAAIGRADGWIAATAAANGMGMTVAARDTTTLRAADVSVMDPWGA